MAAEIGASEVLGVGTGLIGPIFGRVKAWRVTEATLAEPRRIIGDWLRQQGDLPKNALDNEVRAWLDATDPPSSTQALLLAVAYDPQAKTLKKLRDSFCQAVFGGPEATVHEGALNELLRRVAVAFTEGVLEEAGRAGSPIFQRTVVGLLSELLAGQRDERLARQANQADLWRLIDRVLDRLPASGSGPAAPQSAPVDLTAALHDYYAVEIAQIVKIYPVVDTRFIRMTLLAPPDEEGRYRPRPQERSYGSLAELLTDPRRRESAYIILGDPGSGKSTLLRRQMLETARRVLDDAAPAQSDGRLPPVVVLVSLNRYRSERPGERPPAPEEWLARLWSDQAAAAPSLTELLRAGRVTLLLDGLNELPRRDDSGEEIIVWREFLQRVTRAGNRAVFTCRRRDYGFAAELSSEGLDVQQIDLEPLDNEQIRLFLDAYLERPEQVEPVRQALDKSSRMELFRAPFWLDLLCADINDAPDDAPLRLERAALLTSFVRRALAREIKRDREFFRQVDLLDNDDCVQLSQNRRAWRHEYQLPERGCLIAELSRLADWMQRTDQVEPSSAPVAPHLGRDNQTGEARLVAVSRRAALEIFPESLGTAVIEAGVRLGLLVNNLDADDLRFYHQLFQEYFAARHLVNHPEPTLVAVEWRVDNIQPSLDDVIVALPAREPLPLLETTGWEETTLIAAEMIEAAADREKLIRELMVVNLPLAARCVQVLIPRLLSTFIDAMRWALVERTRDFTADLRARIAAGEELGRLASAGEKPGWLGDPRFTLHHGPYGDYLLPPLVTIPAGDYPIGTDEHEDGHQSDEGPRHTRPLTEFQLGVYPVTNAEYAYFIKAGGYDDERWWQGEADRAWWRGEADTEGQKRYDRKLRDVYRSRPTLADERPDLQEDIELLLGMDDAQFEAQLERWYPARQVYRRPAFWEDSRFNNPAQPVVGLSWYEARAYCAWLTAQVGVEQSAGHGFRLPTEFEWEAAARGQAGRAYAYGNTFEEARVNTYESHLRRTTPVGIFDNATPERVMDLTGNIWEWTSSRYTATYDAASDETNVLYVPRGGSWYDTRDFARAAYRRRYLPVSRSGGLGVRLGGVAVPLVL